MDCLIQLDSFLTAIKEAIVNFIEGQTTNNESMVEDDVTSESIGNDALTVVDMLTLRLPNAKLNI